MKLNISIQNWILWFKDMPECRKAINILHNHWKATPRRRQLIDWKRSAEDLLEKLEKCTIYKIKAEKE